MTAPACLCETFGLNEPGREEALRTSPEMEAEIVDVLISSNSLI